MKKLSILLFLGNAFALGACGQHMDASKVPPVVKAGFAKGYPAITPKWEKEDGNYEASFKKDGSDMSLVIDPKGNVLETEMDIKITELPADIPAYVKKHYPGKAIKEASRITRADHSINFEARVNGKDVIFDSNGKFIKESKE